MYRNSSSTSTLMRRFRSAIVDASSSSSSRSFGYQTDLYVRSFDEAPNQSLRSELDEIIKRRSQQANLFRLIDAFYEYGHLDAPINPLDESSAATIVNNTNHSISKLLDPVNYGLGAASNSSSELFATSGLLFGPQATTKEKMSLNEIVAYLRSNYSDKLTMEFKHLTNEEEKLWLVKEFEALNQHHLSSDVQVKLAKLLLKSQALDHFLAAKFPTFKRYSLEGGESSMAFYESLFESSAKSDVAEMVMGIAHRGRLNLMTCMLGLSPTLLFAKIKGKPEFADDVQATGDVAHHLPCSIDLKYGETGQHVHVSLVSNPSHLEAVDPLVLGKARAKQLTAKDCFYADEPKSRSTRVASFLVHGDGAFSGQGIVSETLQLSKLPNYSVGGTVHLIVNNQVAYTLPCTLGRSGTYGSDLAKSINCPIVHVNGDHPELAYKAAQLAMKYRNEFGKDIVVDLICFRRYGHNELDEPMFTNPLLYKKINVRHSVPDLYKEKVISSIDDKDQLKKMLNDEVDQYKKYLEECFNQLDTQKIEPRNSYLRKKWSQMDVSSSQHLTTWPTGLNKQFLKKIGVKSVDYPKDFAIHSTIERGHVKKRIEKMQTEKNIDWSTAESLAFGSLLMQGFNIRLSGQDIGRGTFSQRHAILVDQTNGKVHIPLNHLADNSSGEQQNQEEQKQQRNFIELCNSNLSEEAVMGYEFGFSWDDPNNLVIWEAQFGDFFNGAQIIIDTYIASGETKWMHQSGLVLMLPHGFDGAASEHSSCRIERFLQQTSSKEDAIDSDNINFYFANPTTPANYFHLLRRQMITPYRKPLVIASPKGLLRLPECVSTLDEFAETTQFQPVLNDPNVSNKQISSSAVKKLVFVSGKVFYELMAEKQKRKRDDIAFIRIEQLAPFPAKEIRSILNEYKHVKEFVYAQEEHRNMGAYSFVASRFENILGIKLKYVGRNTAATISGIGSLHQKELKEFISKTFE